jgi:peptide/nickel transport system substrate-binding protein
MLTRGTTIRRPARREVLRWAGAGAGGLVLAACSRPSKSPDSSSDRTTPTGAPTTPAETTSSTDAGRGSATKPLAAPAKLHEAPELTSQVKAGKLPELSDRLPDRPYVLPHNWVRRGHYGGTTRRSTWSSERSDGR